MRIILVIMLVLALSACDTNDTQPNTVEEPQVAQTNESSDTIQQEFIEEEYVDIGELI